jgi:hypothetical protein
MKSKTLSRIFGANCGLLMISFLLLSFQSKVLDWGFFGHRQINQMAVFTLPPDLINFYKPNIDFVKEHAIDPDKRRYASKYEAVRHFINPDEIDTYPFDVFPRRWSEALSKFTDIYLITNKDDTLHLFGRFQMDFEDNLLILKANDLQKTIGRNHLIIDKYKYIKFVQKHIVRNYYDSEWTIPKEEIDSIFMEDSVLVPLNIDVKKVFAKDRLSEIGILPWHLQSMQYRLTRAFEDGDVNTILRLSADFGHYIGDAHVPLHTTKNYNGQYTNQRGIHGFWESRLPELFADEDYSFFVGKAEYIEDATAHYWNIILESNQLVDSVLWIEKSLRKQFSEDEIYCYENVGKKTIRTYCNGFSNAYHKRLEGMVEARMKAAIKAVGDAWFTAWVDAGQPNLIITEEVALTEAEQKELDTEEKAFKGGKIIGREHGN